MLRKFLSYWRELASLTAALAIAIIADSFIGALLVFAAEEIFLHSFHYVPEMYVVPLFFLGRYTGCAPQGLRFRFWPIYTWGNKIYIGYRSMIHTTPSMPAQDPLPISATWEFLYRFLPHEAEIDIARQIIREGTQAIEVYVRRTINRATVQAVQGKRAADLYSALGREEAELAAWRAVHGPLRGAGVDILPTSLILIFKLPATLEEAYVRRESAPAISAAQLELPKDLIELIREASTEAELEQRLEVVRHWFLAQGGSPAAWAQLAYNLGDFLCSRIPDTYYRHRRWQSMVEEEIN